MNTNVLELYWVFSPSLAIILDITSWTRTGAAHVGLIKHASSAAHGP